MAGFDTISSSMSESLEVVPFELLLALIKVDDAEERRSSNKLEFSC